MIKTALGIDIGGTNTALGIVGQQGQVLAQTTIPTPDHGDSIRYADDLSAAIRGLIESTLSPSDEVCGMGIGAPNANFYSGCIEFAPNLSFKGVVPFVALMKERFADMKYIAMTNDANAAVLGEMIYGGAKGRKNVVMYTLGTGVGSGIIVNGELVYGHDGFAGECGHTTLVPGGRLCGCGGLGHLEAYCSASGMKRTAFEILVRDNATGSPLAGVPYKDLTAKMIFEAAKNGDAVALEVFELTGKYLAQAMADTVHHTSPEAIFLFGGPVAAGELLFKPIRENLEKFLLPVYRNKIQILPSELHAGDAAIVGASALVWAAQN